MAKVPEPELPELPGRFRKPAALKKATVPAMAEAPLVRFKEPGFTVERWGCGIFRHAKNKIL